DSDQDRMPVGRRPRGLRSGNVAATAGDVLHIELLSELLRELLRGDPSEDVRWTARNERHDDAHWPRRVIEREGVLQGNESGGSGNLQKSAASFHGVPPRSPD